MTGIPREKLVVIEHPASREVLTRARLIVDKTIWLPDDANSLLTDVGKEIASAVSLVDGIKLTHLNRHSAVFHIVHDELWTWGEIETGVIAAFASVLGVELNVIRDVRTGNGL